MEAGLRFLMFCIFLFMGMYFIITSISCIVRMAIICHLEETLKDSCDRFQEIPNNIRRGVLRLSNHTHTRRRKRINPVIIHPIPNAVETNINAPVVYLNAVADAVIVEAKEEDFDLFTSPTEFI